MQSLSRTGVRYTEQNRIIVDYNVPTRVSWNDHGKQGSFKINYNSAQICADVVAAETGAGAAIDIIMSDQNLLYMTPIAAHGSSMSIKFSDVLSDILPKVKIPVLYHPPAQLGQLGTAETNANVFIDDGGAQTLDSVGRLHNLFPHAVQNDIYHDVLIGDNANIIWDACRDLDI
jgi:hypothetical protein